MNLLVYVDILFVVFMFVKMKICFVKVCVKYENYEEFDFLNIYFLFIWERSIEVVIFWDSLCWEEV